MADADLQTPDDIDPNAPLHEQLHAMRQRVAALEAQIQQASGSLAGSPASERPSSSSAAQGGGSPSAGSPGVLPNAALPTAPSISFTPPAVPASPPSAPLRFAPRDAAAEGTERPRISLSTVGLQASPAAQVVMDAATRQGAAPGAARANSTPISALDAAPLPVEPAAQREHVADLRREPRAQTMRRPSRAPAILALLGVLTAAGLGVAWLGRPPAKPTGSASKSGNEMTLEPSASAMAAKNGLQTPETASTNLPQVVSHQASAPSKGAGAKSHSAARPKQTAAAPQTAKENSPEILPAGDDSAMQPKTTRAENAAGFTDNNASSDTESRAARRRRRRRARRRHQNQASETRPVSPETNPEASKPSKKGNDNGGERDPYPQDHRDAAEEGDLP